MIYGIVPVGGKGTRLSLPFSKEMLPQKNYNFYNPIANHVVEKMLSAGAGKIVFVHGVELKNEVVEFFSAPHYLHLKQNTTGVTHVLLDFYNNVQLQNDDICFFGFPDTIFDDNPFVEMLKVPSICVGLFTTYEFVKVDRLSADKSKFMAKTTKIPENLDLFWGVLKLDGCDIQKFVKDNIFSTHIELGDVLNTCSFRMVEGKRYIDVGTWDGYNRYLSDY
ncbi:MAG: hypothetical protein WCH10_03375 [bacterium]